MPQQLLTRTLTNITFAEFQTWLSNIQDTYTAALQTNNPANISAALKVLDRTQVYIHSFINSLQASLPTRRSGALQQISYGSSPACPIL